MNIRVLTDLLDQPAAEAFGWTLLHSLWQLALIGALAAAALAALRRAGPGARYAVAFGSLLLMLLMPVVTFVALQPRTISLQPVASPPLAAMPDQPAPPERIPIAPPAQAPLKTRLLAAVRASLPAAETLYLAGLLACALRLALGYARLRSLIHHALPVGGERHTSVQRLATRLGLRHAVRLLESSLVEVPAVVGFLRPAILLPLTGLTGLSPQQLEAILAHELAHIRRHDHLVIHLQALIETLLFYHPAVWWLSARIRQEREHCCDDLAVGVAGSAIVYARALESMESLRAAPRHTPAQLVAAARGGALLPRIRRLLGAAPAPARPLSHAAAALLVFAVVGVTLYVVGCAHQQDKTVVARAEAVPAGPQVLMKVLILNVDADYLDAHAAAVPAAAGGVRATNAASKELLAALGDQGHCEIISRPSILVLNDHTARIRIGQQVPVSPIAPIQYAFTGTQVDTMPHIAVDGQSVTIDFAFELSAMLPGTTTQVAGIIDRRSLKTTLTLADGETAVIIGGGPPGSDAAKPARSIVIIISPQIAMGPAGAVQQDAPAPQPDTKPAVGAGPAATASQPVPRSSTASL